MKFDIKIFILLILLLLIQNLIFGQTNNCNNNASGEITVNSSCVFQPWDNDNNSDYWNSASGCGGWDGDDAWGWFIATATSTTISYSPDGVFDPVLHIFTGGCATSMTALDCVDDNGDGSDESITIATNIGQLYRVRIQDWWDNGNYTGDICVHSPMPTSPPCIANPTSPTNGQGAVSTNPTLSWPAAATATGYDVYFGTTNPPNTLVSANQAGTTYSPGVLNSSTTYFWRIEPINALGTTSGCNNWSFTTTIGNDLCSTAEALNLGCGENLNVTSSTEFATNTGNGPTCTTPNSTANGVWYTLTGTGNNITASLCGSFYDTKIFIYTGSCGAFNCVTGNDDFCGLQSQVNFNSTLGTTYYILVTGWGTSNGFFTLSVSDDAVPFVIDAGDDVNICNGSSTQLYGTGVATPYTYQWTPAAGLSNPNIQNPVASPTTTTNYTLTVSSPAGCSETDDILVTVYNLPQVPTVSVDDDDLCAPDNTVLFSNDMAPSGRVVNFTAATQTNSKSYATTNTFTMEMWVNPTSTIQITPEQNGNADISGTNGNQRYAVYPAWLGANAGAGISIGTNGVSVFEHGAGYLPSLLVWEGNISGWTHVAVVYNAKTPSLYINGALVRTGLTSVRPSVSPSAGVGTGTYGRYQGSIDNYRIWNYARTPAQTTADMHWKNPTNAAGLIAHYTFDNNTTNATVGNNLTNAGGTFANANYYTYTWSNGPNLPGASVNEAQTTGNINTAGTHNYIVNASVNGCISDDSAPVPVVVNTPSTAPTTIGGAGTYCHGNQVTLTPVGGTLGSGAQYEWFTTACNGTSQGTSNNLIVSPNITTAYYVNATASGACPATPCATGTVTLPTAGNALGLNNENAVCVVNDNNFIHFYHASGRLLASINSNGQNLGNVAVTSYLEPAPLDVPACNNPSLNWITTTMARHWVITPQFQPVNPVTVRLPYDNSPGGEYDQLFTAANSNLNDHDNIAGHNTLFLSKYSGPINVNNIAADNCPLLGGSGGSTIYTQTNNGLVSAYSPTPVANSRYVDYSIPNFSEFWIHGSLINSPLPVTMGEININCNEQTNIVTLEWSTLSETNNDKFIIEKSTDFANWNFVSEVNGARNSSTLQNYQIQDEGSVEDIYYRIIQKDINDNQELFGPVKVNCKSTNNIFVSPNPNNGEYLINIFSEDGFDDGEFQIFDMNGKLLKSEIISVSSGLNKFESNISDFAAGSYILIIKSYEHIYSPVRIIKTR